jgi:hypothetical protein
MSASRLRSSSPRGSHVHRFCALEDLAKTTCDGSSWEQAARGICGRIAYVYVSPTINSRASFLRSPASICTAISLGSLARRTILRLRCNSLSAIPRSSPNLRWVRPLAVHSCTNSAICCRLRRFLRASDFAGFVLLHPPLFPNPGPILQMGLIRRLLFNLRKS